MNCADAQGEYPMKATMKAFTYTQYGSPDVLQLQEVPPPSPQADEVLIEIHAAALNAADWHLLRADPFLARLQMGLLKPKIHILGLDVAGRVVALGSQVTQFKVGDEVFGESTMKTLGCFAEYVALPAKTLALKPSNLSFEEAAAVPLAAGTALQALRNNGQLRAGQSVLINGASGGVGTFALQLAKYLGAEVTAVCSTQKMEMVRSLGADHVIDYTQEDFTQSGKKYDLILAVNGDRSPWEYRRALAPEGRYVMVGGTNKQLFQTLFLGPLLSLGSRQKLGAMLAQGDARDLGFLSKLLAAGKLKPVIDRCYPFEQLVEAMHYLEAGHAMGKIVLSVKAS
jgi:NADPH:quinone reductase-like Zn-dependent oxidoreductase